MTLKELKNALLQEAVQGKLVPQIAAEGNARDLLEEKLKKEKPLPELTEEEIPFDIPENWCWCRLSEYLDIRDGTHDSPKFYDKGIPFVTSKNLNDGILDFSTNFTVPVIISEKSFILFTNLIELPTLGILAPTNI